MSTAPLMTDEPTSSPRPAALDHEVVIIGSGFSGIGAAVALQEMGIQDFVILERESQLGGTWVQNDYPGLTVDMPFFIYSFPFEMKPDWSQVYPTGAEMKEYTLRCAEKHDLPRRVRCEATVVKSEYDADANVWRTQLEGGEVLVSRYLVSATGLLVIPKMPDIKGIDDFEGKLIHTARWDYDTDLTDKRVAVIGTGATAIQLIPAIADQVKQLDIYQRTAIWLLPKLNPQLSSGWKRALGTAPFLQTLARWLTNLFVEVVLGMGFIHYRRFPWIFDRIEKKLVDYIRHEVHDPETQEKLIPHYSFFCKRPSFSNVFYSSFNRPHVELVTEPIERVTANAIVAADGTQREIDALVCATGYNVFNRKCMPGYEVIGRNGKNLGEFWQKNRFQAYEGATVPGFPNFFLFMGPYSAAGASYFTMIDTQSKHMTRCLSEARKRGANCIEVKQAAHDHDFAKVQRLRQTTVAFGGNCAGSNSYYFDEHGDTPGLRPVTGFQHWLRSRSFPLQSYDFERRGDA
ncbi:MAG: NAD(P)/FAD-dependent oxidoreductase [Deltaproteobacteria bacterium]|nr:NAD(P)/FAD-dependent oxidoreductase [Deltaproteobacteria bacterium]MBW2361207.1 NAD(P)/FAD-dependent oxidoreductase [Deltaproteobacteria bacterium]